MKFYKKLFLCFRFVYQIITFKIIYPIYYQILIRTTAKKIDEKKIIIDNKGISKIDESFLFLIDYLKNKTDYTIVIYNKRSQKTGDYKILKEIASAKYVFLTTFHFLIDNINIRPETKIINLWHGCGIFKKFGYSALDTEWGAKHSKTFRLYKNTNLFVTSSPFCIPFYQEAINHKEPGIVQALGISRTDVFFENTYLKSSYDELQQLIPNINNRKIILYAPTFRGDKLNESIYPDFLDFNLFSKLKDKYVLLIKHHPAINKTQIISEEFSDFIINVTGKIEINKLLCCADILISDYSSLIFEYSLFEKPMIFFGPDIDRYNQDRGFFQDYFSMIPGPLCRTNEELIEIIENIDSYNLENIKIFKNKYMSSCDGKSTERILNYIQTI